MLRSRGEREKWSEPTDRPTDEASRARGNDILRSGAECGGAIRSWTEERERERSLLYLMLCGSLHHRNLRPRRLPA